MIATNDDWQSDPGADEITSSGLAPASDLEAATLQTLAPGAYTAVVTGKSEASGIALVEAYDLAAESESRLANISARALVGIGDNVLIGGFIVGDVDSATVVVRALGPSMASSLAGTLSDPTLTIYDSNGLVIASNDNWQDDVHADEVAENSLAPTNSSESAVIMRPPPAPTPRL